jgi:hypothetical protein
MFHDGHQLHMCKSHLLHIGHQPLPDLVIAVVTFFVIFIRSHPTGQMDLINTPRCLQGIVLCPFLKPLAVFPIVLKVPGDGGCKGALFPEISVRVTFIQLLPLGIADVVFISFPLGQIGYKTFPDTGPLQPYK